VAPGQGRRPRVITLRLVRLNDDRVRTQFHCSKSIIRG
jgi:hypothetical protein